MDSVDKLTLRIPNRLLQKIEQHALQAFPEECCGFLIGNPTGGRRNVIEVVPSQNLAISNRKQRYTVDPLEFSRLDAKLEGSGKEVLGFYHSHPNTPAKPSHYDLEYAWQIYSYLIVSVAKNRALEIASWTLSKNSKQFEREHLTTVTEPSTLNAQ